MTNFLQKVSIPSGWTEEDAAGLPGCVVLRHSIYGATTIDTKRRIYEPGSAPPNPARCTMTYRGRGWEQAIVIDATNKNAGFWNAA